MRTIANMSAAVTSLDLHDLFAQSMDFTSPQYLQTQKDQMYNGFTSKDQRLKKYRSPIYAKKKNEMNSLPGMGNPDFYLTGDFYREMRADIDNEGLRVYSMTSDTAKLLFLETRDPDIWTLGATYRAKYIVVLLPITITNFENALNANV